jgi:hypothetical protein
VQRARNEIITRMIGGGGWLRDHYSRRDKFVTGGQTKNNLQFV